MEDKAIEELNLKIGTLIGSLGFSSSRFADYIDVSRPIISHIIAGRNKPSLEIIQRILKKFPELGIEWTFDGKELDESLLKKLAEKVDEEQRREEMLRLKESGSGDLLPLDFQKSTVKPMNESKKVTKIVVFYNDNSFTEFNPSC